MNPFDKLYSRKSTTVPKVPLYLDLELTNNCNLKCKMCGTNYSKRKKGFMDEKTFNNILKYVREHKIPVRLIGWGEPSRAPKCNKFINLLNKCTIVHINTNGYKPIKWFIKSSKISYHGQKGHGSPYAEYMSMSTTDLEIFPHKILWFIPVYETETGIKIIDCKINKTDTRWIDGKNRSTKRFDRCGEVFDKLTIFWNGDITACCGDVEGKLVIGNINKDNLLDIWKNNKKLNYMRKELRKKNWNCTDLCKICYDYTGV